MRYNTKYVLVVVFCMRMCVCVCVYMQLFVLILRGNKDFGYNRVLGLKVRLAELPAVAALVAHNERSHRFISRARLQLIVGAVALFALATLE